MELSMELKRQLEVAKSPVTGFAVWDETRSSTRLFCPPCFINAEQDFIDEMGENLSDLIHAEEIDWLHAGGPTVTCHKCGREVN